MSETRVFFAVQILPWHAKSRQNSMMWVDVRRPSLSLVFSLLSRHLRHNFWGRDLETCAFRLVADLLLVVGGSRQREGNEEEASLFWTTTREWMTSTRFFPTTLKTTKLFKLSYLHSARRAVISDWIVEKNAVADDSAHLVNGSGVFSRVLVSVIIGGKKNLQTQTPMLLTLSKRNKDSILQAFCRLIRE